MCSKITKLTGFSEKLLYGEPPIAEVIGESITFLSNEVPIRNIKKEQEIIDKALNSLRIPIGMERVFSAEDAVYHASALIQVLERNPEWKVQGDALELFRVVDPLEPTITVSGEDLDIDFGDDVDPEEVFDAWHANRTMVAFWWRMGSTTRRLAKIMGTWLLICCLPKKHQKVRYQNTLCLIWRVCVKNLIKTFLIWVVCVCWFLTFLESKKRHCPKISTQSYAHTRSWVSIGYRS